MNVKIVNIVQNLVRVPYLIAFLLGCFSVLAMAPAQFIPALFIGLSGLYILLARASGVRRAFFVGWCFAFGYHLCGLSWVANALLVEGNAYRWAYPLAICGLPFILAPFTAAACAVIKRFFNLKTVLGFIGFAAVLSIFEYIRGHAFTGFPWNLYGYAWSDVLPITQITALSDIYGLTVLTIVWAGSLGAAWTMWPRRKFYAGSILCIALLSGAVSYVYGVNRIKTNSNIGFIKDVRVKIAAPYIPQAQKWDKVYAMQNFQNHLLESQPTRLKDGYEGVTYIVWPETAVTEWFLNVPEHMKMLTDVLAQYSGPAYVLLGMLRYDNVQKKYYNALSLIDKSANFFNVYDKHHLVPFGEYIPFGEHIPISAINGFSGFGKGKGVTTMRTPEGLSYSPLVCYEAIFSGDVINKAHVPVDVLVNVTNDAWYVGSAGPKQHAVHARFRAVEERVSLIRVSNGGISGVYDSLGRLMPEEDGYYRVGNTLN